MTIHLEANKNAFRKLGLYYPAVWITSALLLIYRDSDSLYKIYASFRERIEAK